LARARDRCPHVRSAGSDIGDTRNWRAGDDGVGPCIAVRVDQTVAAVAIPAAKASASVVRRKVFSGRRKPTSIPAALAARTAGSHQRNARNALPLNCPFARRMTRPDRGGGDEVDGEVREEGMLRKSAARE